MNIIVSVDKNWGIGKDNGLLYHIPEDMQFFKAKTIGNIIVMGKNTLLSLPNEKPLPNRKNIVLSSKLNRSDCTICRNLKELFEELKKYKSNDIFIIGGEMLYRELLPYCDIAYITKVDCKATATRYFPNIDEMANWDLVSQSSRKMCGDIEFRFTQYKNRDVKKYI